MIKCQICEKTFNNYRCLSTHITSFHKIKSKEYYNLYLKKENDGICLNCKKETLFRSIIVGYNKYCSLKCAQSNDKIKEKKKQTLLKHYGVEYPAQSKEIQEKQRQTCLLKYGVENSFRNKEIQEKIKQTNLERYGVEKYSQTDECKNKIKETNLQKYNVEYPAQSKEIQEKQRQTNIEKYGVEYLFQDEEIKEKIKQTNLKKYGVEYAQQSEIIKEKIKETNLQRYGVEFSLQCDKIKEKIKETNLQKYGVENISHSEIIKEKQRQTNIEKYGVEYSFQDEDIKNKIHQTKLFNYIKRLLNNNLIFLSKNNNIVELKCKKCNNNFNVVYNTLKTYLNLKSMNICPYCNPRQVIFSDKEKELLYYIKSIYDGEVIENDRSILKGKELDIYIPKLKLAFEYNGLYWHSDLYKDKNYHLDKTIECEKQDIQLVHIFENYWFEKEEQIKLYINDLIQNTIKIDRYNFIFKKENDNIIVNRNFSNGKILETQNYKLIEINNPEKQNILFENKCFNVYDCGYLKYKKINYDKM